MMGFCGFEKFVFPVVSNPTGCQLAGNLISTSRECATRSESVGCNLMSQTAAGNWIQGVVMCHRKGKLHNESESGTARYACV